MQREIEIQVRKIKELIDRTRVATAESAELQSHWARYLCIVASGVVENAIRLSYSELARRSSSPAVTKYVSATFERLQNPNSEDLIKLAFRFKDDWGRDLKEYLEDEGRGAALNSIMSQRNRIAHGNGASSNISISSLREYLEKVLEIIEFVEAQCLR